MSPKQFTGLGAIFAPRWGPGLGEGKALGFAGGAEILSQQDGNTGVRMLFMEKWERSRGAGFFPVWRVLV